MIVREEIADNGARLIFMDDKAAKTQEEDAVARGRLYSLCEELKQKIAIKNIMEAQPAQ